MMTTSMKKMTGMSDSINCNFADFSKLEIIILMVTFLTLKSDVLLIYFKYQIIRLLFIIFNMMT